MRPSPDNDERRVHPRFPHSIELSGAPEIGGAPARLVASNLSLGGVYCTSDRDYPEMTRLAVRLMLPSRTRATEPEPLDLDAVVVRRNRLDDSANGPRFELALLFTALTAVQRDRLSRFLATA